LARTLDQLNTTQQAADAGAAQLAAGAPVDLHQVMIQMEQANLSLGLALQVRNKLIEAYQEISRMPI
jgi:flagellar hook-basal body complex protein FliE